jgi:hypothetical protein
MGYDAICTLTFDGRTSRGTAWLEHRELVFRGPHRLVVPLQDITEARADGRTLHVRFAGKDASFDIGDAAAKWAQRITNPPSRLDKLGVKPAMRVLLLGIRDEDFERELTAREATVTRRIAGGDADIVFYAANTRSDLARLLELAALIAPAGALWIVRPKGRPEITEAETMAAGKRAGLVDVKVASFSDSHTAEKFVVPKSARQARAGSSAINRASKPARSRRSSPRERRKS